MDPSPSGSGAPGSVVRFTASGKPKRSIASLTVERRYANVIRTFLAGEMPRFTHERHVHVANVLRHLPYGRELMHLGLQTMAHRALIPHKYSAATTDRNWDLLDGALPAPGAFADLPGGACGTERPVTAHGPMGEETP